MGPVPQESHSRPYFNDSRYYASVVFYRSDPAEKSLALNGTKLRDRELVVRHDDHIVRLLVV